MNSTYDVTQGVEHGYPPLSLRHFLLRWIGGATALAEERSEFGGAKRGIKILRAIDHGIGLMVWWWCFGP